MSFVGFPSGWTETRAASAGWFVKFLELPRGSHRLVAWDRVNGDIYKSVFAIHVV